MMGEQAPLRRYIVSEQFFSGFVSLVGRPNVGKSTLMNLLVGEKIAIVSNRPQTTRNTIRSILTGEDYQIVFIDTPGLHKPQTKLGAFMVKSAENALDGVDVVLYCGGSDDRMGRLARSSSQSETVKGGMLIEQSREAIWVDRDIKRQK